MSSKEKKETAQGKRAPRITALKLPELKLIVGSGPGGTSGATGADNCVCVCAPLDQGP